MLICCVLFCVFRVVLWCCVMVCYVCDCFVRFALRCCVVLVCDVVCFVVRFGLVLVGSVRFGSCWFH